MFTDDKGKCLIDEHLKVLVRAATTQYKSETKDITESIQAQKYY